MLEEKAKKAARLLKVLANENRLLVLCVLRDGPRTVGAISDKVPAITLSAMSQHLSVLKANGIIDCDKNGQNVVYRISDSRVLEVLSVLGSYYCD